MPQAPAPKGLNPLTHLFMCGEPRRVLIPPKGGSVLPASKLHPKLSQTHQGQSQHKHLLRTPLPFMLPPHHPQNSSSNNNKNFAQIDNEISQAKPLPS